MPADLGALRGQARQDRRRRAHWTRPPGWAARLRRRRRVPALWCSPGRRTRSRSWWPPAPAAGARWSPGAAGAADRAGHAPSGAEVAVQFDRLGG